MTPLTCRGVATLLLALALTACGAAASTSPAASKPAPGGQPAAIAACSVFTQQDAQGLLGAPVQNTGNQPGLKGLADYSSTCAYGMPASPYDQVSAKFSHYSSSSAARSSYEMSRQQGLYVKGQDVPGVGDAAVVEDLGGPSLLALRGPLTVQVDTTKEVPAQGLQRLAGTLLGRTS